MRNKIQGLIAESTALEDTIALAQIFAVLDLTSLNTTDTPEIISSLCAKATALPDAHVAAVCVYPRFVPQVLQELTDERVRIATVANFPEGNSQIDVLVKMIQADVAAGANEIDVVFPYRQFLTDEAINVQDFVRQCKEACGEKVLLKVILESGAFTDLNKLAKACQEILFGGADFLKTSTGKIAIGATLEAAAVMLLTINEMAPTLQRPIGFKAAGGVRTIAQATQYMTLAQRILGKDAVTPRTFRLGASQLCDVILEQYDNA